MKINTGISDHDRKTVVSELSKLLADSYTLYLKAHGFHWNVTGPMFQSLHQLFEAQYTELATAVDSIAERIRALGSPAPATFGEFMKLTSIPEPKGVPGYREMIVQLVEGNEAVTRTARGALSAVERARDAASTDLLTERIEVHEKAAWMLRSILED